MTLSLCPISFYNEPKINARRACACPLRRVRRQNAADKEEKTASGKNIRSHMQAALPVKQPYTAAERDARIKRRREPDLYYAEITVSAH